jgi:hypothetical protein
MSPEETLSQSLRDYPPPVRSESPVQLFQGWYYIIVGLWVAFAIGTLQSPTLPVYNLSTMWFVRGIGLCLALAGVWLVRASRRRESVTLGTSGPITVALLIGVSETIAMANSVLPITFIMDTCMEFCFLVWWMLAARSGSKPIYPTGMEEGQGWL